LVPQNLIAQDLLSYHESWLLTSIKVLFGYCGKTWIYRWYPKSKLESTQWKYVNCVGSIFPNTLNLQISIIRMLTVDYLPGLLSRVQDLLYVVINNYWPLVACRPIAQIKIRNQLLL